MDINGNLQQYYKTFPNQTANGVLGATSDLTNCSIFAVAQTTANIALTLPSPTVQNNLALRLKLINTGSVSFTVNGFTVPPGRELSMYWDTTWRLAYFGDAANQPYVTSQIEAFTVLARRTPPANITTRMFVNINGTSTSIANAIAPNALAANAYCYTQSGASTPFYTNGFIIPSAGIPSGATAGQRLWLSSNGDLALAPPATANGNIRQEVAIMKDDGTAIVKFGEPIVIQI